MEMFQLGRMRGLERLLRSNGRTRKLVCLGTGWDFGADLMALESGTQEF